MKTTAPSTADILTISDVTTVYNVKATPGQRSATLTAVDNVSLSIKERETVGLVGESGCGKSTLGRTIMRLVKPVAGRIVFRGADITELSHKDLRRERRSMQMVFQDPFASLNPRFTVRTILNEPFRVHRIPAAQAAERIPELLELVGLPTSALSRYPNEFSGGQRQRIAIARALALNPSFVVLDEPVSALDVSIQAQILNLLDDLQQQLGLAFLLIAHDLSVVGQISDRVAVMYLGRIVEIGTREQVFSDPQHPYTMALLSAVPSRERRRSAQRRHIILKGDLPNPMDPPTGCRFRTRCWKATDLCATDDPPLTIPNGGTHEVACHFPGLDQAARVDHLPGFDTTAAAESGNREEVDGS